MNRGDAIAILQLLNSFFYARFRRFSGSGIIATFLPMG
jgi:hypothetical protein